MVLSYALTVWRHMGLRIILKRRCFMEIVLTRIPCQSFQHTEIQETGVETSG
jgi:hypothetical protein